MAFVTSQRGRAESSETLAPAQRRRSFQDSCRVEEESLRRPVLGPEGAVWLVCRVPSRQRGGAGDGWRLVPLCPVYPPAPSWPQRKSLYCSETSSCDPDCFLSRALKSVGKQTQLSITYSQSTEGVSSRERGIFYICCGEQSD